MKKKVALIFPPLCSAAMPYSSLPTLAAFLRGKGIKVDQFDMNVEAFYFLTSYEFYKDVCELCTRFKLKKIALPPLDEIERAITFFKKKEEFFDIKQYSQNLEILRLYFEVLNIIYNPISLSLGGYLILRNKFNLNSINEYFNNSKKDPLLRFMIFFLESHDFSKYDTIGLSVTFDFQLIPALLIACYIKAISKNARVAIGGACISYIKDIFFLHSYLFDFIDVVFLNEGETALFSFIENERASDKIPNCIFRNKNGNVVHSKFSFTENLNSLPSPDYNGLPLEKYFSPYLVGIVTTSRGCYYNKCAFCVNPFGKSRKYQKRSIKNIINDINNVTSQLESPYIFFGDDCIHPNLLKKIFTNFSGKKIKWQTEARIEKEFDYETLKFLFYKGCRQLIFGLESANQRIIDKMDKGFSLDFARKLISNCQKNNINTNIQTMIGFPSETIEEACTTVNFLIENKINISSFSMSNFSLLRESKIAQNYRDFSISKLGSLEDRPYNVQYETSKGIGKYQAEILSKSFYSVIKKYFPANDFFFDGPIGAHSLIYSNKFLFTDLFKGSV